MITFAELEPGTVLGEQPFAVTEEAVSAWTALFPDDAECLPAMPPGMTAMVVMRAYVTIMHDRPEGNIHAAQKFWISRLPALHDRLVTTLTCESKEFKNERRWVTFATETTDESGHLMFRGEMTTIWAQ
jgi:hypothetical protein